ncbi:LruC domain-containing protein [Pedobacter sp. JY14-1]|uniref:LruC domain-containing protein n=1 Tax=Pedobacter sp. JY14-1 TaxID=3034151 RepID=UPI0023E1006F|nr:LruC domain-containing protein [Pedobacter sp. JY14-1]
MKKVIPFFGLVFLVMAGSLSCKKDRSKDPDPDPGGGSEIPGSFSYITTKNLDITVRLLSNDSKPIKGALVSITDPGNTERDVLKAVTDADGYVRGNITVPAYLDTLLINPNYTGLLNRVKALIGGKTAISAVIGGTSMLSGDVLIEGVNPRNTNPDVLLATGDIGARGLFSVTYGYPTGYTSSGDAIVSSPAYPASLGRPKYLEPTPDAIDPSLLSYVNASLPEGKPLTTTHPEYLTSSAGSNLVITQTADVWVTFVSEGAGYLNTLAYYTYDTNNPPSSVTTGTAFGGIDKVTMIFPNASAYGTGGGLLSGDKVKLGTFEAGTTIAFVLLQNAWTGSGINTSTSTKFYSESKFNPETVTSRKKHSVLLYDDVHKLYLMGFEDINRSDGSGSDNDFNDLVIYATANPITAISNTGVSTVDKGGDSDGDGVPDTQDAFPNDPSRAYITYFPSSTGYATLAFEDYWPFKGDYDMNDLVVNYRYTFTKNAQNNTVEIKGEYQPVAAGAGYKNGFGVQFPFAAGKVSSVSGQVLQSNYIQLAGNGVEAGQTNAVVIPFDNYENLIKNADGSEKVNTDPAKPKANASTATLNIKFSSPLTAAELGLPPFNPFLISDRRRAYEIHLPNNPPTDKADKSVIGTYDDNGSVATGRYYLNKNNEPWALSFTDTFSYPAEARSILDAYLHFLEWAKSGGVSYPDWYINTAAGYRNTANIYNK